MNRQALWNYGQRVARHWIAVAVTGGVAAAAGVISAVAGVTLPPAAWILLLLIGVSVAQALAFVDLWEEHIPTWPPSGRGRKGWSAGHYWEQGRSPDDCIFLWLIPVARSTARLSIACQVDGPRTRAVAQTIVQPGQAIANGVPNPFFSACFPSGFPSAGSLSDGVYTIVWTASTVVGGHELLRRSSFRVRNGIPDRGSLPA